MSDEYIQAEIEAADKAFVDAFVRRLRAINALKEARDKNDTEIWADLAADAATIRKFADAAPKDAPADAITRICRALIGESVVLQGVRQVLLAGGDEARLLSAARGYFGYAAEIKHAADAREALETLIEEDGVVACLPWPELPGAGQWWPTLNENRFSDLRILSGWPILPGREDQKEAAIVARKPLSPSGSDDMYAIAHDDIHAAESCLRRAGVEAEVVARVRSLALIRLSGYMEENDPRLAQARADELDGLRIIGAVPRA